MKIVILTAKFGMGHMSASRSIMQDIQSHYKNDDIEIIDFYEYALPHLSKYMYKSFDLLLKYAKGIYSFYYSMNDKRVTGVDLLTRIFASACNKLVEDKSPDLVISTFPMISRGVGYYKERYGSDLELITCITDVSSHYEWLVEGTDQYLVACQDIKFEMIHKGVDPDRIVVYGIPVADKFKNRQEIRRPRPSLIGDKIINMPRNKDSKEVLIMGGGLGILPKGDAFYQELNSAEGFHTTIVAGNNQGIYNSLHGKYENITVLGFTDQVDVLMDRADCIVTKPGGITVFEAIYSNTPILSFAPTLPNEQRNVDFIEENNFGLLLTEDMEASVRTIVSIVNDDKALASMRASMANFVDRLNTSYFKDYRYGYNRNYGLMMCHDSRKIYSY
ncbi:MGDG synthase family glycosyltransferase [Peptostreptococcus sp. MV1]|uniref:MGDG synthase family glycosyltransferase n=1 Tax=Peptostreptococcus sp. MV1 TaxID=1219626 RepID=UPI00056D1F32|nr:galactosyldiacylglycerol synthase [Peptostreptococcus sp. MV1]